MKTKNKQFDFDVEVLKKYIGFALQDDTSTKLSKEEFFKNWHELDELVLVDPKTISKEQRERDNALTSAYFKARRARQALEAAQKSAIEAVTHYVCLGVLEEIARAQEAATKTKRKRKITSRKST